MPDRQPAGQSQQGRGLGGTLKSKMGPLPLWGWLAIMTVIAVAYYLYAKNKSAQQPAQPAAGAPGVTVINQGTPPTSPPPEPKHKDDDDKSKSGGDDKKDDAEEAQDDKSGSSGDSETASRGGQGHRHHRARHH